MTEHDLDKTTSPHCRAPVAADATDPPDEPILLEAVDSQSAGRRLGQDRRTVLLLLFVVLGPLALGVLWKSPRFSRAWKVALTALTLGQFVLVVWLLWYAVGLFLAAL